MEYDLSDEHSAPDNMIDPLFDYFDICVRGQNASSGIFFVKNNNSMSRKAMDLQFSLLMSVYHRDSAQFLYEAFASIKASSCLPDELILVCDGMLTSELYSVIETFKNPLAINVIQLSKNQGLGLALREGLKHCKHELVARFDADDICLPYRFSKQIMYFSEHPEIDILGGQIQEFSKVITDAVFGRQLPTSHKVICDFAKIRNPFNHMTVMFKKSVVLNAGSYGNDLLYEDYNLWVRIIVKGGILANLDDILVYARAGQDMYARRGGFKYAFLEVKQQYYFYKMKFLSLYEFIRNISVRLPVRLLPNRFRALIYEVVLRKK